MPIKFTNNAVGTLAGAVSDTDTLLTLATGQGGLFPTLGAGDYFFLTLGTDGVTEIVKATARSGDAITVTRAQEGTTAIPHSAGVPARLLVTAASLTDLIPPPLDNPQLVSLGVGTAASGVSGEIRATGNITAGFSDDRLKNKLGKIEDALAKVRALTGFYYEANETALALGLGGGRDVGLSAQSVKAVQSEATAPAPVDGNYLTVRYERLVPLLIEAIKELDGELQSLKAQLKG
jgi:hypothetical protein